MCDVFLLLYIWKELWRFKFNEFMNFIGQEWKLYWKRDGIKNGESHTEFQGDKPCVPAQIRITNLK